MVEEYWAHELLRRPAPQTAVRPLLIVLVTSGARKIALIEKINSRWIRSPALANTGQKGGPDYELRDVFHMMLTTHQRESS